MGWKLELVEAGPSSGARSVEIGWLGEILAPASVDDIGLQHGLANRLLGDLQRAVVALQEAALQTHADRLRRLDATLRLKDYRLHTIQSLHGTLAIRVPRLVRIGTGERAPALLRGSSRSTTEYCQVLARLGAWMSFRTAAGLIGQLFPLASGGSTSTVRRRPDRSAVAARRLRTAMTNLREYVDGQSSYLVDYAQRQRAGKPVGTSTSEGSANALVNRRMNKLQQMRWSAAGAHAVVTMRVDAINAAPRGGAVATASTA